MKPVRIRLDAITIDSRVQARVATSQAVIDEYASLMEEGVKFPAIKLVRLRHLGTCVVVDGIHRTLAARKCEFVDIEAVIIDGDMRDAILLAAGANTDHGLPRTSADKRRSVEMLLADPEWRACTDSWIAEKCGVHQTTVSRIRHESSPDNAETVRKRPDGTTVNIANRGRKKSSSKMPVAEPVATPEPKDESEEVHVHHDTIQAPAPTPDPKSAQSDGSDYHRVVNSVMSWPKHRLEQLGTLISNLLKARS